MTLHHLRRGTGKPLLLLHGLGGSSRSFDLALDGLAARREVVAVDLRVSAGRGRCAVRCRSRRSLTRWPSS